MLPIQIKHIKYNFTNTRYTKKYIVIHDTGNRGKGSGALAHYDYFNGGNRGASANFFVDDKNIIETVSADLTAWHCGDGKGIYGITNSNSIGIEICLNPDSNYTVAFQNAVELTRYLMKKYNIPLERVVRHYDASRKNCPQSMNNMGDWSKWFEFKGKISKEIDKPVPKKEVKKVKNIVIYTNYVDKRAAEYLADFLGCATVDGNMEYDYTPIENIYGVGGGNFPSKAKVLKGETRFDTLLAVLKFIKKI